MNSTSKLSLVLRIAAAVLLSTAPAQCDLWGCNYQFIPSQGYYEGQTVYYLMTDVSSSAYALSFNVNYTPILANALRPELRVFWDPLIGSTKIVEFMPDVYYVTNNVQNLVFSAEWPTVAPLTGGEYMPLWVLNEVTWTIAPPSSPLTSVAAIEAQRLAGNLTVTRTDVVVGASIIINSSGTAIKQAFVDSRYGRKVVRLPIRAVFVDGQVYKIIQLDSSNSYAARTNKANYAPWLSRFNALRVMGFPLVTQDIYSFWPRVPVRQLYIARQVPSPFGPNNTNADYSPLMTEWQVRIPSLPATPYTQYSDISGFPRQATNYINFQPVVGQ